MMKEIFMIIRVKIINVAEQRRENYAKGADFKFKIGCFYRSPQVDHR